VIDEASATANTSNSNPDSCQSKFITHWKLLSENFGAKRAKAHRKTSQPAAEEIVKKEAAKEPVSRPKGPPPSTPRQRRGARERPRPHPLGFPIECEPCGRHGRYNIARLIADHDDARLPELLTRRLPEGALRQHP
jgi:hypothetical protein